MTDISQLPTTLQAISLADLGVISQSTTAGAIAVRAPLSSIAVPILAAPAPIGSGAPNTGAFTTLTTSTSFLLGTGSLSGSPYQFQSAISFDPSAAGASGTNYRESMFYTTLNYTTRDTTNIWEGLTSFVTVNGPHNAQGEINAFHAYLQINSGVVVTQAECIEASASNNGSVTSWDGVLSIITNGPSATATGLNGMVATLTNQNPTAGAINNFTGLYVGQMAGGGSLPTNYYAIHNADSAASISTVGGIAVGTNSQQPNGPGSVYIQGADNSSGTFPFQVKNLAGTNLIYVNNAGNVTIPNSLNTTSGAISSGAAITAATVLNTGTYTVSGLPTASANKGARAFVTDATAPTFLGSLTGGGTVTCPVMSNGTIWIAG